MREKVVFTPALAAKLLDLLEGKPVASSRLSSAMAKLLLAEGLITVVPRGSTKSYRIINPKACRVFISQQFTGGMELEEWLAIKSNESAITRADLVSSGGHSKLVATRAFRGFLANCYDPIEASINSCGFLLQPVEGTAVFIEDFAQFCVPKEVVIVGVENGENFQNIRGLKHLFAGIKVLFVSRYPQSKDLVSWLQTIPNRYVHFGDFDLAGIHIYQHEFYASLGSKASFFVPDDIEDRLRQGNSTLYDKQYRKYKDMQLPDERLQTLVDLIHRYRKGYEQEGYIE